MLPTQQEIDVAFQNTNFGAASTPIGVLVKGVKFVARRLHNGSTLSRILVELGLAEPVEAEDRVYRLTERGLEFLLTYGSLAGKDLVEPRASGLAIPEDCPHMIVFDDSDRKPVMLAGAAAKEAAQKTFDKIGQTYNAHLFVRIASSSKDDEYPNAQVIEEASNIGERLANRILALEHQLDEAKAQIAAYPADWRKDSSLETWFPLSAQQINEQTAPKEQAKCQP